MKRPSSLRRRIVVAYLFFALAVCTFFGIVAAVAIEGVEDLLVDEHLRSIASWASPRHANGMPVDMPSAVSFYHDDAIPPELRNIPPGVVKKTFEGKVVHLLAGQDRNGAYVVVDRASEYKNIEHAIYAMIAAGFLGFVALSLFLGRFIAHGFVEPITQLAEAVQNQDAELDLPLLTSDDELGVLARSFAAHTAELKRFLARERFFTGDVSHELRTPLTIITGAAELLIEQTAGQPALHKPAERILRAAREATDCVAILLLLARAPDRINRPETSVAAVIREEVARCQHLVRAKPVILHYEEGEDFSVAARRELLTSAIGNLIRNACQYTEQGSVTVRVRDRSVIVEDTGPGLPESIQARLQNDASSKPLVGSAGSGLGLALVMRICEYMGAKLSVENNPKNGSNFRIVFQTTLTLN
ncbi:MAG TPA: HAMP domain-containing sensor histidine kinase [Herminiimonas sp.]|nr:HAMP domain-containing sensor histidine kinase [Herminiimonas sp.]